VESASDAYDDLPYDHPQHRLVVVHCYPVLALIQGKSESLPDFINTNGWQLHALRKSVNQNRGSRGETVLLVQPEDHIPANHLLRSIDQCLDLNAPLESKKISTLFGEVSAAHRRDDRCRHK